MPITDTEVLSEALRALQNAKYSGMLDMHRDMPKLYNEIVREVTNQVNANIQAQINNKANTFEAQQRKAYDAMIKREHDTMNERLSNTDARVDQTIANKQEELDKLQADFKEYQKREGWLRLARYGAFGAVIITTAALIWLVAPYLLHFVGLNEIWGAFDPSVHSVFVWFKGFLAVVVIGLVLVSEYLLMAFPVIAYNWWRYYKRTHIPNSWRNDNW